MLGLSTGAYYYQGRRTAYLQDPVMQKALLHLQKDYRVVDFCGQSIEPCFWVTRDKKPGENWVKFDLKVKGTSGSLKIKVIGDYLTHQDLYELEAERKTYNEKHAQLKKEIEVNQKAKKSIEDLEKKLYDLESDYIPIDFDSYSILQDDTPTEGEISNKTQLWRISSLTA